MYFDLHKDRYNRWRWTYWALNCEAVCTSAEGFAKKEDAMISIQSLKQDMPDARVYDESTRTWL